MKNTKTPFEFSMHESKIENSWLELVEAARKYWQLNCYEDEIKECDIFGPHKDEIIQEVVDGLSQAIFEATDGWVRFLEETVDIEDKSENNLEGRLPKHFEQI